MTIIQMKYCVDCGWLIEASSHPEEYERGRQAIEHHLETGHYVRSGDGVGRAAESTVEYETK
ncbi:MAG: hypothetical protein IH933_02260 [Euryarchaeota archaeon]|nr:hypothetical protein [Euryarchaeota archaeon]